MESRLNRFYECCGNFFYELRKFYVYGRIYFLSGFFLFVCAFNRILCFTVKRFFYDAKYRRFFGFIILGEDLDDLGGFLESAFILSLFLILFLVLVTALRFLFW